MPRPARLLALALGTSVAGVLAFGVLRGTDRGPAATEFFEPSLEDARRLTDPADLAAAADLSAADPAAGLVRWTIPEEAAKRLFPIDGRAQVYDPVTHFRYPAGFDEQRWWPTGFGRWRVVTNAQGLREDEDLRFEPVDLRVLVTGDSHTDGVCRNYQSFANRLEQRLAEARPEAAIDCVNAGKGGYSFYQYLGVLEKFADLRPDLFVVATYGGNDLHEVLTLRRYFRAETFETLTAAEFFEPLKRVKALDPEAVAQGLLMVKYFQLRPDDAERALETTGRILDALRERCADAGSELLLVYLPPWFTVQRQRYATPWDAILEAIELTEADLGRVDELADRLLADARTRGIEVLDLRPVFRAHDTDLYWEREWHLNPKGHGVVGRELETWVRDRFPAR